MSRFLFIGLILLSGCNESPNQTSVSTVSLSAKATSSPASAVISHCEFVVGAEVPKNKTFESREIFPTEGDERLFYKYRACNDLEAIKVEIVQNLIYSIELNGTRSCVDSVACVGDLYKDVLRRNHNAKLYLSRIEGKAFSLIINEHISAKFSPSDIADSCYDGPKTCDDAIGNSRVTGLYLH